MSNIQVSVKTAHPDLVLCRAQSAVPLLIFSTTSHRLFHMTTLGIAR